MDSASSILALLSLFAIASAVPGRQNDIGSFIDSNGLSISAKPALKWTSRSTCNLDGGPCELYDGKCFAVLALKYVNEYRATQGKGPLKQGTVSQYNNAIGYSEELKKLGSLTHQNLGEVELGCGSFFSAENIAQNFCAEGDPARRCVDQWINSSGHRANLLGSHDATSVGIFFDDDTKFWCTQTFSKNTVYTDSGVCAALTAGAPATHSD